MQVSVCACRHLYIVIHLSGLRAESYIIFSTSGIILLKDWETRKTVSKTSKSTSEKTHYSVQTFVLICSLHNDEVMLFFLLDGLRALTGKV